MNKSIYWAYEGVLNEKFGRFRQYLFTHTFFDNLLNSLLQASPGVIEFLPLWPLPPTRFIYRETKDWSNHCKKAWSFITRATNLTTGFSLLSHLIQPTIFNVMWPWVSWNWLMQNIRVKYFIKIFKREYVKKDDDLRSENVC